MGKVKGKTFSFLLYLLAAAANLPTVSIHRSGGGEEGEPALQSSRGTAALSLSLALLKGRLKEKGGEAKKGGRRTRGQKSQGVVVDAIITRGVGRGRRVRVKWGSKKHTPGRQVGSPPALGAHTQRRRKAAGPPARGKEGGPARGRGPKSGARGGLLSAGREGGAPPLVIEAAAFGPQAFPRPLACSRSLAAQKF